MKRKIKEKENKLKQSLPFTTLTVSLLWKISTLGV